MEQRSGTGIMESLYFARAFIKLKVRLYLGGGQGRKFSDIDHLNFFVPIFQWEICKIQSRVKHFSTRVLKTSWVGMGSLKIDFSLVFLVVILFRYF